MTEATASATWGMLAWVDTGESIRPATRDEWATGGPMFSYDWTGRNQRYVQVIDGPEMLPCGHARHEHIDRWRPSLIRAAELIAEDLAWQTQLPDSPTPEIGDTVGSDVTTLCTVAVVTIGLLNGQPLSLSDVMQFVTAEGGPRAATMLDVTHSWAVQHFAPWELVVSWGRLLSPRDWGMIVAVGSYAAGAREMTSEQIREFALSLLDGHDHG